jgi:tRNA A-37 threonylcarbamoyl transferase component Bud32
LVDALRQFRLLEPAQLSTLASLRFSEPKALAKVLLQRKWLTAYQAALLIQGKAQELQLGSYVLLDRLGEGGMGQVFKARNWKIGQAVALKIIRKEFVSDTEIVGRFYREVQVTSQLNHPNVIRAYDAGPVGETHFLAMEYVEGRDLDHLVKQSGPLTIAQACDYIRQAALGLQAIHELGLVHRDIKPSNLLLTQAHPGAPGPSVGLVKILDLGLARLQESIHAKSTTCLPDGQSLTTLTLDGPATLGSVDYLSPEQALDFHRVDIRADIYSLGCTFYFLLTGKPPFGGGPLAVKLMRHQQAEPPKLERFRSDVPPGLSVVIQRMLAKRPQDRYQTPSEVAEALAEWTPGVTQGAAKPRRSRSPASFVFGRPRLAFGMAGLLLAGMALVLVPFSCQKPFAGIFQGSGQADLRRVLDLLNKPDNNEQVVLDRLGKFVQAHPEMIGSVRDELLAVRMRQPGSLQATRAAVWLTYLPSPLDQLDRQQIPEKKRFTGQPPELVAILGDPGPGYCRVTSLVIRPDCRMLAMSGLMKEIAVWDFSKGTPQKLPGLRGHGSYVMSLAFTLDNRWLASGGGDNNPTGDNKIRLWDVSQPEIKAEAVLAGHTNTVNTLAISPDGQWLASSGQDQSVRFWNLASHESQVLATRVTFVSTLAFAPDGKTVAMGGSYWKQIRLLEVAPPVAGKHVELKYAAQQYTHKVAFAPEGQTLAADEGKEVVLWDVNKQEERGRLKGHTAPVLDLVYLPDGETLISGEAPDENQSNVNEPEGRIIAWSLATGQPKASWRLPCGGVKRLALASDGRHLAVGGRNSVVYILRLAPPKIGLATNDR